MAPNRSVAQRQDSGVVSAPPSGPSTLGMQYFSVDRILRDSTEIPSGQPRVPPSQNPPLRPTQPGTMAAVRAAARAAARRAGGPENAISTPTAAGATTTTPGSRISVPQNVPQRTTKVSQKLVLIPDAVDDDSPEDDDTDSTLEPDNQRASRKAFATVQPDEDRPLRHEEREILKKRGGIRGKSYAERLPKRQRADMLARLTAYCTAQGFKITATADFLRTQHEAKTKLYDDCLYVVYHLPFMTGSDGYRLRSRPILKTPGTGKTLLDLEIERSERRDQHYGWAADDFSSSPGESPVSPTDLQPIASNGSDEAGHDMAPRLLNHTALNRLAPDPNNFAEMFVFSYGVVVFWNFTERQEKDILGDLTFAESEKAVSLATRPFEPGDYETEEFHFEYSADIKHPRIFNDMITLLPRSDHMVKLTISHAVAQSTKLCSFEERMSGTMKQAEPVPKRLAMTGELSMGRTEIVKLLGRLFKSRVDINLSSNILPVPNFFWESEPNLHPLYMAIRDYLEIDPRIKVLNERCRVFLDLAEILSDTVADAKMSAITWIIIVLIIISICVTVSEVGLRVGILRKSNAGKGGNELEHRGGCGTHGCPRPVDAYPLDTVEWKLTRANITREEFWDWMSRNEPETLAVCCSAIVGKTFAGV